MDNSQDSKIHDVFTKGEAVRTAVLTSEDIAEIRSSNLGAYKLANKYAVWPTTIYDVLHRRTWDHIH